MLTEFTKSLMSSVDAVFKSPVIFNNLFIINGGTSNDVVINPADINLYCASTNAAVSCNILLISADAGSVSPV